MSKAKMTVSQHGSGTSYKFDKPVSRKTADAMIAAHKGENKRVSEWLCENTDSHAIQEHAPLAESFKKLTGHDAPWNAHTQQDTERAINTRGKGGSLTKGNTKLLCYGYEMAEACAAKWGKNFKSWQTGLGFRFNTAIDSLRAAGN